VNVSPENFGKLFSTFKREAFRLETLDTYTIPDEQETFRAFLDGAPQPEKHKKGAWVNVIREHVEAGKRMYRVHIVARPLSDYLRYEMGWGYHRNQEAGEEFFVLDITDEPNPLAGLADFWMFDEKTIVSMRYNDIGEFLGAELLPDERTAEYIKYRDTAMSNAQPFQEWWERYA
jgi:hypothetical protein